MHYCIIYIAMQPWCRCFLRVGDLWNLNTRRCKVIQMKNRPFFNEKLGIIFFRTKYKSSFQCPIILFYQNIFLVPLPHHLLKKKKKIVYFSNFCLSFLSYIYACSRVVGPQPENCELLSPTQLELGLTHGSRYVMQL